MVYTRKRFYGVNYADLPVAPDVYSFLEATESSNIQVNKSGVPSVRKGRQLVATLSSNPHSIAFFEDINQNKHVLLGANGSIYDDGDGAGSPAVSYPGLDPGAKFTTVSFGGFLIHVNGVNTNLKFDGTTWTRFGIPAPAAAPTIAENGVGILTGDFNYVYCYVYKNAALGYESESACSALASLTGVAAKKIKVSVVADPTGAAQFIRIYRQDTTMLTMQLVVELANATADYDDNIATASLGAELTGRFEGAAPILTGIIEWKNRLWGWAGNILYCTRVLEPEKWWTYSSFEMNPTTVDPDTSHAIIGAKGFGSYLVIYTEHEMKLITGNDETTFILQDYLPIDCISFRSIQDCGDVLTWQSKSGTYTWDAVGAPKHISYQVDNDFSGASRGVLETQILGQRGIAALYTKKLKQYWMSCPVAASITNLRTLVHDFNLTQLTKPNPKKDLTEKSISRWYPYNIKFVDACETNDGVIYSIDGMNGKYYRENIGTTDEGTTVSGFYISRHFHMDEPSSDKRFHTVSASGFTTGSTPITFTTLIDQGETLSDPIELAITGDTWGADPPAAATDWWGTDAEPYSDYWGGVTNSFVFLPYQQEAYGRLFGFRIDMDTDAYFIEFEVDYRTERRPFTS